MTIVDPQGKEAVLAHLGSGDFLGEGSIIGNRARMATAAAMGSIMVLRIEKKEVMRLLHEKPKFAQQSIHHLLERNMKIEADLGGSAFNSSEKRCSCPSDTCALRKRSPT